MKDALDNISLAINHLDEIANGTLPIRMTARLRDIRNALTYLENDLTEKVEGPAATKSAAH